MMKMLYRLENDERNWLVIKQVETDQEVGFALRLRLFHPDGSVTVACELYNTALRKLDTLHGAYRAHPVFCALMSSAWRHEQEDHSDLSGLKRSVHADRVERRLGTLLADTALAFARG